MPALKQIVNGEQATLAAKPSHLARLHALWTLEGLEAIDKDILYTALKDEHPQIRKAAVLISESFISKNDDEVIAKLSGLRNDPSHDVRLQLFLSAYNNKTARTEAIANELLTANSANPMFAASQKSMDRNIDIKTYGSRLANIPAEERKSILAGANIFTSLCVTCHGAGGKGMAVAGASSLAAPILTESKRINADKSVLAKIILHGLAGPIDGKQYPSIMPSLGANSDEWVASVVNYVRYEFGSAARRFRRPTDTISPFITPVEVKSLRDKNASRQTPWTIEELEGSTAAQPAVMTTNSTSNPAAAIPASSKTSTAKKPAAKTAAAKPTTYSQVHQLLQKNACLTCHNPDTKVIGPSYKEIARRKYSVAQLVQLIQKPKPENWPGYATKMPPMSHVPKTELTKIAEWIKTMERAK